MRDLIKRLLERAGIRDLAGHDLRRTFATLVRKFGADEFLTMRLLRDRIPGVGSRYIQFPLEQLVVELKKYSPLSQLAAPVTLDDPDGPGPPTTANLPAVAKDIKKTPEKVIPEAKNSWWRQGDSLSPSETRYIGTDCLKIFREEDWIETQVLVRAH